MGISVKLSSIHFSKAEEHAGFTPIVPSNQGRAEGRVCSRQWS